MKEMRREEAPARRVVIAGGGNIGFRWRANRGQESALIERDGSAHAGVRTAERTIVLHGDAADEEQPRRVSVAGCLRGADHSEEANILSPC
jgi:trk system potassium uptake protein TrkA